ncbi:MAG: hypothetical protein GYB68_17310, partial [Chloroflexi bacterium]|nr:hypothetical protein [Chloroflexota bacterium]
GIAVLQDFIEEWASPDFHGRETWPFIWLLLTSLIMAGFSRRRLDWREAIFVSGTAYMALLAGRNIAVFALAGVPVLSRHLSWWLEERGFRPQWRAIRMNTTLYALNWMLVIVALGGATARLMTAIAPETIEEALSGYPVEALTYMRQHDVPQPLYNSYNWGGYLIWSLPDYPVFVDGRTDLYNDEILNQYFRSYFASERWSESLEAFEINSVLVDDTAPLVTALELSPEWSEAYRDEVAVIYIREVPLNE